MTRTFESPCSWKELMVDGHRCWGDTGRLHPFSKRGWGLDGGSPRVLRIVEGGGARVRLLFST